MRFHDSKVITVSEEIENIIPYENITFFRQDDERWAEDKLGNSVYSMKKSGCLVTCIAATQSMETDSEGKIITPKSLNEQFSSGGVYDREGNLQWENFFAWILWRISSSRFLIMGTEFMRSDVCQIKNEIWETGFYDKL